MKRPSRLELLLLLLLLIPVLYIAYCFGGFLVDRGSPGPGAPRGAPPEARADSAEEGSVEEEDGLTAEQRRDVERLQAIGYAAGGDEADSRESGVVFHDSALAYPGPMLVVSGHGPEAVLIDVTGRVLHRWYFPASKAWPEYEMNERQSAIAAAQGRRERFFRRAYVLENGDLLAIFEGLGIVRCDKDSNLIWARENGAHHSADIQPDGTIYVLTRTAHVVPEIDAEHPVLEDFIVELAPDGTERRRVSLIRSILSSEYRDLSGQADPRLPKRGLVNFEKGDIYHTNSVQVLLRDYPGIPWARKGSALVCSPHLCALLMVELDAERVSWLHKGDFLVQHEPRLLDGGTILFFDNHTVDRGSRALEIDPVTGEEVWQYPPPSAEESFFSSCCGIAARLPNGNTHIVITNAGRAIEVTPDHRIVWEFLNPNRVGPNGEVVANLFDGVRLDEDFPLDWAEDRR